MAVYSVLGQYLQWVGLPIVPIVIVVKTSPYSYWFQRFREFLNGSILVTTIQGVGQVNVEGPTIWKFISLPMLNLLRFKVSGDKFILDLGKDVYHIVGYSFVGYKYLI